MYESLATQGRESVHTGLAGIDSAKLKKLRSTQLRECFNLIDEMRHKMEFVARIRGISFVDDAASRSTLSTWYAMETVEGEVAWIANGAASTPQRVADMKRLRPLVDKKVRMIIAVGDSALYEAVFGDLVDDIRSVASLHQAVERAFYSDREELKVLFSPAVENGIGYEQQGDEFKREVNEL